MFVSGDLDVVTGVDAEAPGVLSVRVKYRKHGREDAEDDESDDCDLKTVGYLFGDRTTPNLRPLGSATKLLLVVVLVETGETIIEIVVDAGCCPFRWATKAPAIFALIVCARNRRRLIVGHDRALITSHGNSESPEADSACT